MDYKNIAIIDHVGSKSGMDCYDDSLTKALSNNGCGSMIFSNYLGNNRNVIYKKVFEGFSDSGRLLKFYRMIRACIKAGYISKKAKVDMVIVHLFSAEIIGLMLVLVPKIFNLKIALIAHDISSFRNDDKRYIQKMIYNYLTDLVIVHNEYSFDKLFSSIDIKERSKVHVIRHGGYLDNIKTIDMQKARAKLGLNSTKKYLLFFGQIKNVKGLDILLRAMPNINENIQLIIAGKLWKNDFSYYDDLILKKQIESRIIKKLHFIENSERDYLYAAANMLVLPYRKIYQSGVLLMAMSYGLPVIASDLHANKEVIRHMENGLLFQNENEEELASLINKTMDDAKFLKDISNNAIDTIKKKYSWDSVAIKYIDLLDS